MYKKYTAVDSTATLYGVAVTESVGAQAVSTLTLATNADASSTLKITIVGVDIFVAVATGDTPTTVAAAAESAINSAEGATLPVVAGAVAGVVTITASNRGLRGNFIIGRMAAPDEQGLRASFTKPCLMTVTKAITAAGATPDDGSAAIASVANSEIYYQVSPWQQSAMLNSVGNPAVITDVDSQNGELRAMIRTQALPINGKEQCMIAGYVDDQASATTIASTLNSVRAFLFRAERNEWTPAMLAAQNTAVARSQQVSQPAANFAGYQSTDSTVYQVLAPFSVNDRPSTVEIRADLNNGVSPIAFRPDGKAYLVRFITTRCRNDNNDPDYRARPGHITSVIDFAWNLVKQRWESTKQPFVADNPKEGESPKARTTTPQQVEGLMLQVINDLVASTPLGQYQGPILAPDKEAEMKKSIVATKMTAGISVSVDFYSVEHLYKGEFTIQETGAAY
jgi:phage tail sheath gpL-like